MDTCSCCKKPTFCALVKVKTDPPKLLCELCLKNINLVADKKDYEDCDNCGYNHHIDDRCVAKKVPAMSLRQWSNLWQTGEYPSFSESDRK